MLFLKTFLLLFFFIAKPLAALETRQGWELAKQEKGITVYTRKLANSNYPEFRGEMNIDANIDELLDFIDNDENCAHWRYKCIKMINLSDKFILTYCY